MHLVHAPGVALQADRCALKTMHGNVELVRAHLSGVRQLQALGVPLDKYTYCSVAPIIQSVGPPSRLAFPLRR